MAENILVTPERLRDAATAIERMANDYQSQYQALYTKTNALNDTWKGDDNQAFTTRIAGFKPDLEAMFNLMNRYVAYLRQTAQDYDDTQADIIRRINQLNN